MSYFGTYRGASAGSWWGQVGAAVIEAMAKTWGLFRSPLRTPFREAKRPMAWDVESEGTGIAYMRPLNEDP